MAELLLGGLLPLICIVLIVLTIVAVVAGNAIRILPEYQRLVVFRLGRAIGARGPGIVFLTPFVDSAVKIDLREQVREVPHQVSITKDKISISIDFLWYYKVFDPVQSVTQVSNFEAALQGIATTALRSEISNMSLDDVLSQREQINQTLRVKLDEITERWGVKVTNVEIREIVLPREVQDAVNRQFSAGRV